MRTEAVRALAKLTVSLRITGVRDDGYHLIDAEMVTVDLADELTFSGGRRARGRGGGASGPLSRLPGGDDNLVRRALGRGGRHGAGTAGQAHPGRRGAGGGLADAAAVLRWAGVGRRRGWLPGLGADVPFCVRGGRARVTGDRRHRRAAAGDRGHATRCWIPPFGCSTPEECTAPGTPWAAPWAPGPTTSRSAALAVEPELARLARSPR